MSKRSLISLTVVAWMGTSNLVFAADADQANATPSQHKDHNGQAAASQAHVSELGGTTSTPSSKADKKSRDRAGSSEETANSSKPTAGSTSSRRSRVGVRLPILFRVPTKKREAAPAAQAPVEQPASSQGVSRDARTERAQPSKNDDAQEDMGPMAVADGALALDGYPVAGMQGGRPYLRDEGDMLRVFLGARLDMDALAAFGPGVSDTRLNPTFRVRRARISMGGQVIRRWQWLVEMDAAASRSQPLLPDETARWSPPMSQGDDQLFPTRAYVDFRATKRVHFQLGQFNVPFTLDNRTSTMQATFMERSLMARAWAVPMVRDIGLRVWGTFPKHSFHYSVGVFGGDGPGKLNPDRRAMFAARAYSRPLADSRGAMRRLQVGASVRYGMHNKTGVSSDYPAMSSNGGYRFWNPIYLDHVGDGRLVHVIPSGASIGGAFELRIPYDNVELQAEASYVRNSTREAVDGYQKVYTERYGVMKGLAYYVQVSYWLFGSPNLMGERGDLDPASVKFSDQQNKGLGQGLEVAARWEQIAGTYDSASRTSGDVAGGELDGDISVYAASLAANYWLSRHFRLGMSYTGYLFPDSTPTLDATGRTVVGAGQRAVAPGNRLPMGVDEQTRQGAHSYHELMGRVSVGF